MDGFASCALLNPPFRKSLRATLLGLTEKQLVNCEFDLTPSDNSDVNTNSKMFSDDTEERSWKSVNPELSVSIHREHEISVAQAPANTQFVSLINNGSRIAGTNDQQGQYVSVPKKSTLKIGQSSAFLRYVKSVVLTISVSLAETTPLLIIHKEPSLRGDVDCPTISLFGQTVPQKVRPCGDTQGHHNTQPRANLSHTDDFHGSNSFPDSVSLDESSTPPLPAECSQQMTSKTEEWRNNSHPNVPCYNNPSFSTYPYYVQGAMNQVMMSAPSSSPASMYPPHYPPRHMPGMTPFPFYPQVNIFIQPGQMPQPWSAYGSTISNDGKIQTVGSTLSY